MQKGTRQHLGSSLCFKTYNLLYLCCLKTKTVENVFQLFNICLKKVKRQSYASSFGDDIREPDLGLISTQLLINDEFVHSLYSWFSCFFFLFSIWCIFYLTLSISNVTKRKCGSSCGSMNFFSRFTLNNTTKAENTSEEGSGHQRKLKRQSGCRSASCRPAAL